MSAGGPNKGGNPNWKPGMKSPNPKGRPKRKRADAVLRDDGWSNVYTSLGQIARDKRTQSEFLRDVIDWASAQELWRGNDIAANVIEAVPAEMLRSGYDLRIQTEDDEGAEEAKNYSETMTAVCEELCLDEHLECALQKERAFGGAAIMPVVNDGSGDLSQPLNEDSIMTLSHLKVFEPRELTPVRYYGDLLGPKFGRPEVYRLTPIVQGAVFAQSNVFIHESRLTLFRGIWVSEGQTGEHTGWGDSILSRVNTVLRDFGVAWESVGSILQEFAIPVYKYKALAELIADKDGESDMKKRVSITEYGKSVMNAVVLDKEDEYQWQGVPLSGIPEILDRFNTRLAAACGMPVTLLMGVSPAGLNATGESDRAFFYDRIARRQRTHLKPKLERLLKLIFRAGSIGPDRQPGPTGGREPENWSIQFRPLWEPTAKEQAETRKVQADSDAIYLDRGVLTPYEVAASRFGGDAYSHDTVIDMKAREAMKDLPPEPMNRPVEGESKDTPPDDSEDASESDAEKMDDFNEEDHPRDEVGKFSESGGGGGGTKLGDKIKRAKAELAAAKKELAQAKAEGRDQRPALTRELKARRAVKEAERAQSKPQQEKPQEQREPVQEREPVTISDAVEKQIRSDEHGLASRDTEKGIVYGVDGKQLTTSTGTATGVRFTAEQRAQMKDGIMTHNHPGNEGVSFSPDDIFLSARDDLAQMRAVARFENRTYVYTATRPSRGWPREEKIRAAFERMRLMVAREAPEDVLKMSKAAQNHWFSHETNRRVASELKYDYQKVEI